MQEPSPAEHSAPILDRRSAEAVALKISEHLRHWRLLGAPPIPEPLEQARPMPTRERFVREVRRVSPVPAAAPPRLL
jgi:hypothetical protein